MKMLALLGLIAVCVADETVKGVTFTDAQAQATLDAANKATFYTLHYTFDIYDYKTNNIIAGRHYPSLTKLSQVSGVSKFVLNLFKTQVSKVCPPLPSDMSGNYKGVSFTNTQAVAAVKAANLASYESLTKVADIYDSKVEAIFRARPVCDMTALAAVDGMTHTPLKLLKGFYSPDDCYTNDDCATGTRCFGIPHDKILSTGKCRPTARIPGEGAQCSSSSPCQSGLYCAGLLGHPEGTEGNCVPEWMVGTFVPPKGKLTVAVPSDAVTTNEGFVPVWGLASVPVDVVLSLKTDGNLDYSSIKIVGVDPNGATATFWDGPNETGPFPEFRTLGGMISRDDSVNGAWKILVSNPGGAAQNGRVFTFSFFLSSRWD